MTKKKISHKKRIWQYPWRYEESIAVAAGMLIVGLLLQYHVGSFPFMMLQWPVNGFLGLVLIGLSVAIGASDNSFSKWLSGVPFAVTVIIAVLILSIIMGLTPQMVNLQMGQADLFTRIGFRQMTSSWAFVFLYTLLLISLGGVTMRRLFRFRLKDYAFYLNHVGLWVLLLAAGLSASDMRRYVMYVREGETEWRVYDSEGGYLELPVAIKLNDFIMEEYPPQIAIIDRSTGIVQPQNKPEWLPIDEKAPTGQLSVWNVELKEYIHEAIRSSDSTYRHAAMPGSTPAALLRVTNPKTGTVSEGWVCGGNQAQLYMTLSLDDKYTVVMSQTEPKKFISDVEILTQDGTEKHAMIEVNKPAKAGNWTVYQYGYDSEAGKLSSYSSFELVYDLWIVPVYAGIIMLAAGSLCMLWIGNRRKEGKDDVE